MSSTGKLQVSWLAYCRHPTLLLVERVPGNYYSLQGKKSKALRKSPGNTISRDLTYVRVPGASFFLFFMYMYRTHILSENHNVTLLSVRSQQSPVLTGRVVLVVLPHVEY